MYFTGSDNDLYRSRYVKGEFRTPESLGGNINTSEAEYNAFVASDESYIIFTSHGWGEGLGEYDLYISYRKQDGSWTRAMNMGPRINSFARDYCPSVSPDGRYFFFASSRLGTEDIFWMDASVIEDLKSDAFK
jgi:Tol biopolymer transport system component